VNGTSYTSYNFILKLYVLVFVKSSFERKPLPTKRFNYLDTGAYRIPCIKVRLIGDYRKSVASVSRTNALADSELYKGDRQKS